MRKALVDLELLERIASDDEGVASSADFEDLKRVLAQPAEADGVEVVAWMADGEDCSDCITWTPTDNNSVALIRQSDHLAALSAVTAERDRLRSKWARVESERDRLLAEVGALRKDAERDRLREDRDSQQRVCIAEMEKVNQLRDEIEALRSLLSEAYPHACWRRDSLDLDEPVGLLAAQTMQELIDRIDAAMAAKETEPEHVCSGCGAKGWTGNCLACIPY